MSVPLTLRSATNTVFAVPIALVANVAVADNVTNVTSSVPCTPTIVAPPLLRSEVALTVASYTRLDAVIPVTVNSFARIDAVVVGWVSV